MTSCCCRSWPRTSPRPRPSLDGRAGTTACLFVVCTANLIAACLACLLWAINVHRYEVDPVTALLYPISGTGQRVITYGNRVRGMAMFRSLGSRYLALSKCSYAKGYRCRLEFHLLDEANEKTIAGHSKSYDLDPGQLPVAARGAAPAKGTRGSTKRRSPPSKPSGTPAAGSKAADTGTTGTVAVKIPVPTGGAALTFFESADLGLGGEVYFMQVFDSAADHWRDRVATLGGDTVDSVYVVWVVAVALFAVTSLTVGVAFAPTACDSRSRLWRVYRRASTPTPCPSRCWESTSSSPAASCPSVPCARAPTTARAHPRLQARKRVVPFVRWPAWHAKVTATWFGEWDVAHVSRGR